MKAELIKKEGNKVTFNLTVDNDKVLNVKHLKTTKKQIPTIGTVLVWFSFPYIPVIRSFLYSEL